jgi:hypothetical protein
MGQSQRSRLLRQLGSPLASPAGLRRPAGRTAFSVLVLSTVLTTACVSDVSGPREIPDVGVVHVHGLGVDPADETLYAATHSGLFRIDESGDAERVGDHWHDLMGFTVVGPNRFIASGHPDLRTDLPPLLGVVESIDAGATWAPIGLTGEADLHALEATDGRLYAYDGGTGRFMTSTDGRRWEIRSQMPGVVDIAVAPSEPATILAVSAGGLLRSSDGGRTWGKLARAPTASFLAWDGREVWLVAPDAAVFSSVDGGSTWQHVGTIPGGTSPEAFVASDRMLYAAMAEAGIYRSDDGVDWEVAYER